MDQGLQQIYDMVKASRVMLFVYLESMPLELYTREHPDVSWGSIRNIHLHVADTYEYWTGEAGLKIIALERGPITVPDVAAMHSVFANFDKVIEKALEADDLDKVFTFNRDPRPPLKVTLRWLIMHPVTHEFHHKGQIVTLGRMLGHPVPAGTDLDLVLPDY